MKITASPLSSNVSMSGILAPLEKINIVAPFKASVKKRYFQFGSAVKKGDPLVSLDTADFEINVRNAKAEYIKALKEFEDLKNWQHSREMSRANRSIVKARRSLDSSRRKSIEAKLLYDRGISSANEYESALESLNNAQLEVTAAEEELATVKEKGSLTSVEIAQMSLTNAEIKKKELETKLKLRTIISPVSGIVLRKAESSRNKTATSLEKGAPVNEGDVLFSVGNLAGMSITSQVDEIDIGTINIGQEVAVFGDAFAGITLLGEVHSISYQASTGRGVPTFGVKTVVKKLSDDQRVKVRLGMSASLQVKVYDNPQAILVPIGAVKRQGADHIVMVKDQESGQLQPVPVKTGLTTLTSVEIKNGLTVGDEIVVNN